MKYALYKTNGTAEFIETAFAIDYEILSKAVGGNIEYYNTQHGEKVYINEEGRLKGLAKNPFYYEDLRGDVVEVGDTDEFGNTLGLPEDYQLRSAPKSPYKKGGKYTLFFVGDNMPMTGKYEFTVDYDEQLNNPAIKLRGKRKLVRTRTPISESMIFEGWDLPIKTDSEVVFQRNGMITSGVLRMNALFNLAGMPIDELRSFIDEKQINPFFILKDHVNYVAMDGTESLMYPHLPATSSHVASLQSKQLQDGIARIVIN